MTNRLDDLSYDMGYLSSAINGAVRMLDNLIYHMGNSHCYADEVRQIRERLIDASRHVVGESQLPTNPAEWLATIGKDN